MSHLDEGTLHALLDGEIPSTELGAIQAHLAGCVGCRARLDEGRQLASEAMGLVEMMEVPEPVGVPTSARTQPSIAVYRRPWVRGLAWAASVIGAVGLGYAVRGTANRPGLSSAGSSTEPEAKRNAVPRSLSSESTAAPGLPAATPVNQARTNQAPPPRRDEARHEAAKPAPAPPPAPNPAPPSAGGVAEQNTGALAARESAARDRLAGQPFAQLKVAMDSAEPVSFPEALRRLNGSIYLISGMVPVGLEARGATVSVVYPGRILLVQELVDGRVTYRLLAPPGFPADSLEMLRARVRE